MSARAIIEKYLAPDDVRHSAPGHLSGSGTGRDKLMQIFQSTPAQPGPFVVPKRLAVMADDDRLMLLTTREMPDPAASAQTN